LTRPLWDFCFNCVDDLDAVVSYTPAAKALSVQDFQGSPPSFPRAMDAFVARALLSLTVLSPALAGNASACEDVNNWLGTRPMAYSCSGAGCPAGDSADGHVKIEEGDTECNILVKSGPATASDATIEASAQALCTANGGGNVTPAYDCDMRGGRPPSGKLAS